MYLQKVGNKQKNFFVGVLVKDENSRIRSWIQIHWSNAHPRIRIRTKMSRIHSTAFKELTSVL